MFSRNAAAYKQRLDSIMARKEALGRQRVIELLELKPGMRVLDLACGPGTLSKPLAALVGPNGSLVGVDLAEGMIALARGAGIPNATFEVMDLEQLTFPHASFDAAACGHGLQFVPDLSRALAEARRVLRPLSRFAASVPLNNDHHRPWQVIDEVVDRWLPPAPAATDQQPTRSAVADPDAFHDGIKSPEQVERLVSDARRANLNALLVQVRKTGDAYFNHADEPRAKDIEGTRDFDPLAYVIRLAHASVPRIEVHAWVNTFFSGQSSRVYVQHGDEWGNRTVDGEMAGYFDPGVPEVQIYMHRVFMDIARNYDIDGIHLDFVRYPGATWGYSQSALDSYAAETGATATPDPSDPQWQAWRRARVTGVVLDLHPDLQEERPSIKLSGALICFGAGPLSAAGWSR